MDDLNKKIEVKDYIRTDDFVDQNPGRMTASILDNTEIPVAWLITLPGLRNEHKQLRYDMGKIKKLSKLVIEPSFRNSHPIELEVHHHGEVFIFDGNHRARAAKIAGLDSYPVKIRFYGGAENNFDINRILTEYPIRKENDMSKPENKVSTVKNLIAKAKLAIANGFKYDEVVSELHSIASEGVGGSTDVPGSPVDQEYANLMDQGADYGGENDVDKGNAPTVGPRDLGDIKASLIDAIRNSNRLYAEASHIEQIEIPFSDLDFKVDVDYSELMAHPDAFSKEYEIINKYIRSHVYGPSRNYTLVTLEKEDGRYFADVLVFDRHINHESSSNDTNDNGLNKVSNISSNSLEKTAWKLRLTVPLDKNDETGLVCCPLEGGFLVRLCGTCPLAGNPHTYIAEGAVECHFDDLSSWLSGNSVKEHRPLDSSSNT